MLEISRIVRLVTADGLNQIEHRYPLSGAVLATYLCACKDWDRESRKVKPVKPGELKLPAEASKLGQPAA
jgi:hypothetical protein